MEESGRAPKRSKQTHDDAVDLTLVGLLKSGKWTEALSLIETETNEAATFPDPSPLAIACRLGAPVEVVKALLEAAPHRLRHVLDSRGTPLHEAIVCEESSVEMVDCLLQADEALPVKNDGSDSRATLLQDVDGFTPLHLLIRRRFQSHILFPDQSTKFLQHLERMVHSCPTAVLIPDCGEYQEPPIVYALKANIYAPSLHSQDERVEKEIFRMVQIMLRFAPAAAGTVFCGFRGHYSALHSAVFHGRYTSTIQMLLETEARFLVENGAVANNANDDGNTAIIAESESALLTNTQSELPLHFCAMRGERPSTVDILAKAAPSSVAARDASGLTPFHWVWIRFVSTLLSLQDRDNEMVEFDMPTKPVLVNQFKDFCKLEHGDFETDLQLIRKLDPPVDFLRMRHIPPEVADPTHCDDFAKKSVELLEGIRRRRQEQLEAVQGDDEMDAEAIEEVSWTRQEAVVSLFWTKAVSLLEATAGASQQLVVHTAFSSPSCFPPVAFMAAALFPDEMKVRDRFGKLPIHYAASRSWHAWETNCNSPDDSNIAAQMLQNETLHILEHAIQLSPREAMRVTDLDNRLPLHCAIDALKMQEQRRHTQDLTKKVSGVLRTLVSLYPESLQRRDGKTKLYPFLQAATGTTHNAALSISYDLLRENPLVLSSCSSLR